EFSGFERNPIDSNVDHRGAWLDPVSANHFGPANCGDQQVGPAAHGWKIVCSGMRNGHCRIFSQEQLRHRLANNVCTADDDRLQASKRFMHGFCEKNAAQWRAWNKRRQANREPACVHRVKTVHVLSRIDSRNDFLRVDLPRKRQLDQNAADFLIGIKLRDDIEQLRFARACGKLVIKGAHARVRYRSGFGAHIHFAGRIVANQHHGNAWYDAAVAPQAMNGVRDLAAQVGRDSFAVNDARAHVPVIFPADAKRDGRSWPGDDNFYPVLLNLSNAATSVWPSPEITTRLRRPDAPADRTITRGGAANILPH